MVGLIKALEDACLAAGVTPVSAVLAIGRSRATWYRWKAGTTSPTLRDFEAMHAAIAQLGVMKRASEATRSAA